MSRSTTLVTAAMFAVSLAAGAQDWRGTEGRIEGRVLDPSGQPIEGATVKLELPGHGGTTVKTDKKGRWALAPLIAGSWQVDIGAPGYTAKKITVPLATESTRVPPVEVKLERAPAAPGPLPEILVALKEADAAFDAGRFAEARTLYEKALADPKVAVQPTAVKPLHMRISRCLSAEGNYESEMEHLQALLEMDASDTVVINLMAQEALRAGKLDKAMELLGRLDPATIKDPDTFFNIGALLLNANKPDAALPYFSRSVGVDPAYVDGYFQRALVYLQLQKFAESRADFEKVLALQPEGPKAETAKKALAQLPR